MLSLLSIKIYWRRDCIYPLQRFQDYNPDIPQSEGVFNMPTKEVDGNLLKRLIINGSINLKNNSQTINDLNVFPVPDGDTGSNMQSTMMSGVDSIDSLKNEPIEIVGKALSRGLLMGARGNSGVILSQLFSGFAKAFKSLEKANAAQLIEGLKVGVDQAYGAVINPVEGTILTVAREAVEKAASVATESSDVLDIMEVYLQEARESLERTPDLLPVLKESGVVDSGGAGLIVIIEGMVAALKGQMYEVDKEKKIRIPGKSYETEEDVFGYCTEFIIQLNPNKRFNKEKLVKQLGRLGDSIVVVADDEVCKVHVHTEKPGDALNIGQIYGEFANLKIENMTLQHSETLLHAGHDHDTPDLAKTSKSFQKQSFASDVRRKYGIITVVNGEGLKETFREMGVNYIIDGGQTMNPATEEFFDAVDAVNADNVIIIPNNKNVFLSAEHAAKNIEDKNVIVIPAKTVAQGYASLTMFDANQDLEETIAEMHELIEHVKTGEVTYAIRNTEINGMKVKKNDFIGIEDGDIVVSKKQRTETVKALLKKMIDDETEIVTIMVGEDVDDEESDEVELYFRDTYPEIEVEVIDGHQTVYAYLIAVE